MINSLLVLIAYLIGSVSSAIIICKLFSLPNPRTQGSGNPGATNVLRIGGKLPAALVFIADFLKGLLPILIAKYLATPPIWLGIIAFAAFLGHLYPIFFKFQGGKGVATAFGAVLGLNGLLGILLFTVWLLVLIATRYVSLASIIAAICTPFFALIINKAAFLLPLMLIAILTIWRHRSNIKKLLAKTENKIGKKKNS